MVAVFKSLHGVSPVACFVADPPSLLLLKEASKISPHCRIVVGQENTDQN